MRITVMKTLRFGHCMFSIIMKVFTIYTLRNGSHVIIFGQLGSSMRLIGPYVWVNLLGRVHLRCFGKI